MHAGQLKAGLPCAISPICSGWKRSLTSLSLQQRARSRRATTHGAARRQRHVSRSTNKRAPLRGHGQVDAWRFRTLVVVGSQNPKCVPWPTPVHTHRAAVGAARALLQVFRSLAAVCSPSIVAFDFGFSDRSFSATLCEKDNPERKPPSRWWGLSLIHI